MERLAATAAALLALVAVAVARQREPHVVLESTPATWFEHLTQAARVSADGRWALTGRGTELSLVDLARGVADDHARRGPFRVVDDVAFAGDGQVIRLADIDGHRGWRLDGRDTSLPLPDAAEPVLSPDGRRLAYVRPTDRAVVQVDATAHDLGAPVLHVQWTPDGERLVALTRRADSNLVVTIDPATGRRLDVRPLPVSAEITSAETVAWSPDGSTIAIESKPGGRRRALWLHTLADGTARHVVDYEAVTFGGVDWTPDGRALVFGALAGERMQLFAIDLTTGRPRQLTDDRQASLFLPQVSPDGRFVAATAMRHTRRLLRLPWR